MSTYRGASYTGRAGFSPRGGRFNRGGGFGRGGGRGGGQGVPQRQAPPQPDIVKHPLGDLVSKITTKDIDLPASSNTLSAAAVITDCEYVTSYNWINESASTIMVPGKRLIVLIITDPNRKHKLTPSRKTTIVDTSLGTTKVR